MANGIHVRMLPKVGDAGLAIHRKHLVSTWQFNRVVADFMRRTTREGDESWFQLYDRTGWLWGHGIVDRQGRVRQIG